MKKLLTILILVLTTTIYAGNGKFGGLVFFDYSYDLEDNVDISNNFGLHRVYFTYQQEVSEGIVYKFQTDIDYSNSPMNVYLKNAKIDWSSPIGKLTFGLQGMNVFNVQEKTWGYRFIEKSAMDKRKFSSSADMGIGFAQKLAGKVHVSALYTNGTGYKKSENDSHKKLSAQVLFGEKRVDKNNGYNIGGVFTYEPYEFDSVMTESKIVMGVFGGYAGGSIRTGGEFNRHVDNGSEITKQLISLYAIYKVSDKLNVFGRLDMYDPNSDIDKDGENYIIAGIDCAPGKGLIIAPNVRYVMPEEGDAHLLIILNFQFKF